LTSKSQKPYFLFHTFILGVKWQYAKPLIINDLGEKRGGKYFFVGKKNLFNFAANKKPANAGNIRRLIFFEKRKV
jgi:hypothetical protein